MIFRFGWPGSVDDLEAPGEADPASVWTECECDTERGAAVGRAGEGPELAADGSGLRCSPDGSGFRCLPLDSGVLCDAPECEDDPALIVDEKEVLVALPCVLLAGEATRESGDVAEGPDRAEATIESAGVAARVDDGMLLSNDNCLELSLSLRYFRATTLLRGRDCLAGDSVSDSLRFLAGFAAFALTAG